MWRHCMKNLAMEDSFEFGSFMRTIKSYDQLTKIMLTTEHIDVWIFFENIIEWRSIICTSQTYSREDILP